jgi:hypothetical protein
MELHDVLAENKLSDQPAAVLLHGTGDRVECWDRWFNAGQADTRLCEMLVCDAETLTEEKRQTF